MILIKEINDKAFWHASLREFEDANIYQTWNFASIVQNEKRVKHLALYLNQNLISLVTVRIRTVPFLNRGIAYILNGPVWQKRNQEINIQILADIFVALREEFVVKQQLVLRIQPFIFSDMVPNLDFVENLGFNRLKKIRRYQTLVLYLDKEFDEIRKNLKQKWRNCLNQSERNDLEIEEGNNQQLYNIFLGIYDQMIARKKFKEYIDPYKMGEANEALDDEYKKIIFIAYKDKLPVAGIVGSIIGNTGIYLLGASNEVGMKTKASYLLQWEMIKWLKQKGCQRYDLGGINKDDNPGGYHFKSGITDQEVLGMGTFESYNNRLSKNITSIGEFIKR
ncbi:MAG: peptidoglycan bridge formation glycyltransferase FemA/FemB family protein [Ignavibacterium sp.]|jgi:lipid II:glycine glycyltransferase (peptidoglycan interpeptide bridge formation enzyme)|nr:peptidoglycan bridge formation glycyltransferase FemA/FemB family protein [Ignavibacterium sp.]